ncbi:CaiB/BaiF CoA transferase family protein [Piscinibacter sakaiensis]|uniref:CaiB/BaiF CoA transferase family protein n=1 Tax=Piscinibacter sakaiensis TaxID=1547922 RepID=UPI003AAEB8A2
MSKTLLSGLRVIDLTRILAGPLACQTLGDYGAEIIKIERPGSGDDTRTMGGPALKTSDGSPTSESATYLAFNRNKKSVTLDIAKTEGQQLLRRLVEQADVLVENYKFGTLTRYGLGYEALRQLNPRLVYCSITGFGQTGPYRRRAGYDPIFQAMGGMMSINGERDGRPGAGPMRVGLPIVDIATGMHAVAAILAALHYRDRVSGEGQFIDAALLDVETSMMSHLHLNHLITGQIPQRWGNENPTLAPYEVLSCRAGRVMVSVGNEGQFRKFCDVLGDPGLATDPRFCTNAQRLANREQLIGALEALLAAHDGAYWADAMEEAGVGCGPINDLAQVLADPQVQHRHLRIDVPHPLAGSMPMIVSPMRFSEAEAVHAAPPTLGQHTREVLQGLLGMADAELDALASNQII